jgi:transposase
VGRPAKYPAEFRREAVALVRGSDRAVAEVARSLGIAEATLWNWVKADREAAERAADPNALSESEQAELKRLRKLTAQQAIDLEILRKAAAYFARETNR